ncbi:hypothetical protein ACXET9_14000 [Brachybacterium sp. DNPG3]
MTGTAGHGPTPEEAQALLARAAQAESTTRTGASWPQIAGLLGLGAASSLALPAIAFAPTEMLALPLTLMILWITASIVFMTVFSRSVKRGFGKRWITAIVAWGILWTIGIVGTTTVFAGQIWFLAIMSGLLTALTLVGAWIEAAR